MQPKQTHMRINTKHALKREGHETGIVLVITLWVIVILSTAAISLLRQVQLETKMVGFQRDTAIVDQVAKSGLRQAMVILREDIIKDSGENFEETIYSFQENDAYRYDGGNEEWADNPEYFIDVPFYENGEKVGYYYVDIKDEAAKFPINNMDTSMNQIQHLLELTGVDEDRARYLAGAIIDWRDGDFQVVEVTESNIGRGDGGNENSYYSGERRSRGDEMPEVVFKNAPIDTVDELLMIPGMTPEIVYGTVSPDDQRGRGSRGGNRRLRQGEYLGLRDYISVYTSEVNLNTVKREVLEALLYGPLSGEAEDLAEEWIDYRDGRDGVPYTDDDQVLKTPDNSDMDEMHYTEARGWTPQVLGALQKFVSINSDHFIVRCMAEYQGIQKGYRVVVQRWYIPWNELPVLGFETNRVEDLEQARFQIRLFEPIIEADDDISKML